MKTALTNSLQPICILIIIYLGIQILSKILKYLPKNYRMNLVHCIQGTTSYSTLYDNVLQSTE